MKAPAFEAHRGVSRFCPENTLAAFREAARLGYDMIELDPKFTADGVCVLCHDRTVNRTARNADGSELTTPDLRVDSLTFGELRKLDFGLFMGEDFRGEKCPSLDETLAFALDAKIPLKFDNVLQSFPAVQRDSFFETVRRMKAEAVTSVTASKIAFLKEARAAIPDIAVHYDGPVTDEILAELSSFLPPEKLTVWLRFDNRRTAWNKNKPVDETSAALVKRYAKLGVWILTDRDEYDKAASLGADLVETDGSLSPADLA